MACSSIPRASPPSKATRYLKISSALPAPASSIEAGRFMSEFKPLIAKAADGRPLSVEEAKQAFDIMMSGEATPAQIGGFLMALRVRGEAVSEITGAVMAMRERMVRVEAPVGALDIVGTGGDGSGSYNIS